MFFDSWAWWEVFHSTPTGKEISRRHLRGEDDKVHTSTITLGELAARLEARGAAEEVPRLVHAVRRRAHLHDVDEETALAGGRLRAELRTATPDAGLIDGIILASARRVGARLISDDRAFRGQPDVSAV